MSAPVGRPFAEAVRATRRFGTLTAVDAVSLTVRPGEIVGLLGANGAGKTTLITMLLGLVVPTSGTVAMFGAAPSIGTRRRLGYVPQGLGLWETLTVAENVAFAASAYGADPGRPLPAELDAVRDRVVGEIGLGLQRRLAFAIALGHEPLLLVLDEPTSGVDPLSRARLWDTIHEQAEGGVGVLVTTHYMQEAQQCDRLVLMSAGRCVAQGSEADIVGATTACEVRPEARPEVRADPPAGEHLAVRAAGGGWAQAFDALEDAGLPVTLAGRRVRVADTEPDAVRAALAAAGVPASVHRVTATLEEAMAGFER